VKPSPKKRPPKKGTGPMSCSTVERQRIWHEHYTIGRLAAIEVRRILSQHLVVPSRTNPWPMGTVEGAAWYNGFCSVKDKKLPPKKGTAVQRELFPYRRYSHRDRVGPEFYIDEQLCRVHVQPCRYDSRDPTTPTAFRWILEEKVAGRWRHGGSIELTAGAPRSWVSDRLKVPARMVPRAPGGN